MGQDGTNRYIRFRTDADATPRWGVRSGPNRIEVLTLAPWRKGSAKTGETLDLARVQHLAPAEPTKILALGYNYKGLFADPKALSNSREAHYTDPGFEPLVFLKGPNCLTGLGEPIPIPAGATEVWVEVEVAAVLGRRARNLRGLSEAREAVFGVTIGNDVSALNILGRDWHLARSKSLDGFCPLGPELVRGLDDGDRKLTNSINGRVSQSSTTKDRVLNTYEAVMLVSRIMTLEPGDVVLTGTPVGARQSLVRPGDRVEMEIEGLGKLWNPVVAEAE